MPGSRERDEEELEMRTILGVPLVALEGYAGSSVADDYSKAPDLCIGLGRVSAVPRLSGPSGRDARRLGLTRGGAGSSLQPLLRECERERERRDDQPDVGR